MIPNRKFYNNSSDTYCLLTVSNNVYIYATNEKKEDITAIHNLLLRIFHLQRFHSAHMIIVFPALPRIYSTYNLYMCNYLWWFQFVMELLHSVRTYLNYTTSCLRNALQMENGSKIIWVGSYWKGGVSEG